MLLCNAISFFNLYYLLRATGYSVNLLLYVALV